jgi:flavin reductase
MDITVRRTGAICRADSTAFRTTMQHLCGAVVVISTEHEERDIGMAATAVCSVSDDPPTVMVCVNKSASIYRPLLETGRYAISILGEAHIDVVQKFSSKDEDARRERLRHFTGESGMRAISGALAVLHCSVVQEVDCGTHTAFFAQVEETCVHAPDDGPLLYFRQAFHSGVASLAKHAQQQAST